MKRILYIGIYNDGSTSKMRADIINEILSDWEMDVINTDIPKRNMGRLWQSIGARYKKGPLVGKINKYVLENLCKKYYDLIWIDKAIYLTPKTTQVLRKYTGKLVHYTPDTAFSYNRSINFYNSMPLYDYMVTTKSFEMEDYIHAMGNNNKVLYVTQGFNKNLHRPIVEWKHKKGIAFIGRYEDNRRESIDVLLQNGINITLAGPGWEKFAKLHPSEHLNYLGSGIFGDDYVHAISSSLYAWGSISKWFPEKHTTRTFEIPACKTALLTERNDEIEGFFAEDEVIYYDGIENLISKVKYYNEHPLELKTLIEKGYQKVQTGGFDYESIIRNLLTKII